MIHTRNWQPTMEGNGAAHELINRPEWHDRANCGRNGIIGDNPTARSRIMFPTDNEHSRGEHAKTICYGCPVKADCYAANKGDNYGIWYGTTVSERSFITRTAKVGKSPRRARLLEHISDGWHLRSQVAHWLADAEMMAEKPARDYIAKVVQKGFIEERRDVSGQRLIRARVAAEVRVDVA